MPHLIDKQVQQKYLLASIFLTFILTIYLGLNDAKGQGVIKGVITDAKTHETIVGANVILQGTTMGASSDLDGNYEIKNIPEGTYNVVVSFISYSTKIIPKVKVSKGQTIVLNIEIEEKVSSIEGITVTASRRNDTEISVLSSIRQSSVIANGISAQTIQRTQDRDASEVIRRLPGVTLMDNRFIMVRGLSQRYNNVWLNGAATPSSESDARAFSFDVIPSSQIENILVYKSASAELPADFSGAAVMVSTKSLTDENNISIGYTASYRQGTTFKDFKFYHPGNLSLLGIDNGFLSLPKDFPAHLHDVTDKEELTRLGQSLNNMWSPTAGTAIPDQRFQLNFNQRFIVGKASIGNITSVNYSNTNNLDEVFRADFIVYNEQNDHPDTSYYFNDNRYVNNIRIGALHNWQIIFSNNQRIEFRNLFNHFGTFSYIDRNGRDNYGGQTIRGRELRFQSRNTYSGQLGGHHQWSRGNTSLNWTLGYSYADKNDPDIKRVHSVRSEDDPNSPHYGDYGVSFSFAATPELSGRVFQNMSENILVSAANFERSFSLGSFKPTLKLGFYAEDKSREFEARNIGYVIANMMSFDWNLPYESIDSIFSDENINNTTGIRLDETTNASDSYQADNQLIAAYSGIKFPLFNLLNLYAGVRMEQNKQTLDSYSSDNATDPVHYLNDELKFFPSANLSVQINENSVLKASYGMTINRPEFREIAPFAYYDFELKRVIRGNDSLTNSLIHNFDLRYEFYPSAAEIISLGAFYKNFMSPIETIEINSGSGRDYTFQNALGAYSAGLELDIRKSFANLGKKEGFLRNFRHFSLVMNASYIKSEIEVDTAKFYARSYKRPMMGQSPFIVNAGIYYQNDEKEFSFNLLYNVIGKRIVVVGLDFPDIYEMPRHSIDLTISKSFRSHLEIKFGIQDILNQPIKYQQYIEFEKANEGLVQRQQVSYLTKPGSYYSLGLTYKF